MAAETSSTSSRTWAEWLTEHQAWEIFSATREAETRHFTQLMWSIVLPKN